MFPTLGVGMEEAVKHDPDLAHGVFRAFNRWAAEDWGLDHAGRIFTAPYITLLDPDQAGPRSSGRSPVGHACSS